MTTSVARCFYTWKVYTQHSRTWFAQTENFHICYMSINTLFQLPSSLYLSLLVWCTLKVNHLNGEYLWYFVSEALCRISCLFGWVLYSLLYQETFIMNKVNIKSWQQYWVKQNEYIIVYYEANYICKTSQETCCLLQNVQTNNISNNNCVVLYSCTCNIISLQLEGAFTNT